MKNIKFYKIFALSAFISELIIFFMIFGKIRNLFLNTELNENPKIIYFLLIIAALILLSLLIWSIQIVSVKDTKDIYVRNESHTDDLKNIHSDSKEHYEQGKELLDHESYLKKIIPKDQTKFELEKYTEKILSNIAKEFDVVQGLFFVLDKKTELFNIKGKYAYFGEEEPKHFKTGETLSGQVAKNKTILVLKEIPENYVTILSGLGSSSPNHLIVIPILFNEETIGIIELASFKEFKHNFKALFETMALQIGQNLTKY